MHVHRYGRPWFTDEVARVTSHSWLALPKDVRADHHVLKARAFGARQKRPGCARQKRTSLSGLMA